jgi:hypothetical protein
MTVMCKHSATSAGIRTRPSEFPGDTDILEHSLANVSTAK